MNRRMVGSLDHTRAWLRPDDLEALMIFRGEFVKWKMCQAWDYGGIEISLDVNSEPGWGETDKKGFGVGQIHILSLGWKWELLWRVKWNGASATERVNHVKSSLTQMGGWRYRCHIGLRGINIADVDSVGCLGVWAQYWWDSQWDTRRFRQVTGRWRDHDRAGL